MSESETTDGRVLARATISLAGLKVGELARVDPANPYIRGLLEASYLVPVEEESPPADSPEGVAA